MTDKKDRVSGKDFENYLAKRVGMDMTKIPSSGEWSGAGDTFGAIALKLNLISMSVIDTILLAQADEKLLFGEVAIKLGVITPAQASCVLEIQRFHRSLETGERLVVNGHMKLPELLRILADFLAED